jgi:hypothetical protein
MDGEWGGKHEIVKHDYRNTKLAPESGTFAGFSRMLKDNEAILGQLSEIKALLESYKTPDVRTAWKLNQTFSDYIFFVRFRCRFR